MTITDTTGFWRNVTISFTGMFTLKPKYAYKSYLMEAVEWDINY
jgi:hypothetical protein